MGSTLEHGIYLPSEGEKNCYSGLANNWQAVDTNIGYVTALRQAIAGALTRQIVTQLPTEDIDPNCIYMILKATAQTSNIYDEYMYINSSWELIGDSQLDLSNYYTKQEVNQLPAIASGITGTKVGNYDAHIANGDIHVTASDKAKWNTLALIKHLRLVNAQVGSATTIPFSDFDDTNGIKVGDKCADLDVKVFEITAVDTANQTVTVGSALIDIALDANVVHLTGDETKNGELTASKFISNYFQSNTGNIQIQSKGSNRSVAMFNGSSAGEGGGFWAYGKDSSNGSDCRMQIYNTGKSRYERTDLVGSQFLPTPSGELDCGGTSNKWKTFNGLEPSALGMPDFDNAIDISGYVTVVANANKESLYTPPDNGWICVRLSRTSGALGVLLIQGDLAISGKNIEVESGVTTADATLPVVGGVQVSINSALADGVVSAKFFPCQGNV